jgi:hypothetical protein
VRPDRELLDRYGRGLSRAQIRTLVDQLEAV